MWKFFKIYNTHDWTFFKFTTAQRSCPVVPYAIRTLNRKDTDNQTMGFASQFAQQRLTQLAEEMSPWVCTASRRCAALRGASLLQHAARGHTAAGACL